MTIAFHLVAHTRGGFRDVVRPESGRWLWGALRAAFPGAFAATLMPDHVHVAEGEGDVQALERTLRRHGRRFGTRWDVLPAQPATTPRILGRTVRYIVLNASREGFAADPWCWPWSTLRDLAGAVVDPWTEPARIAKAVGRREGRLLGSVTSRDGITPPPPHLPTDVMVASLDAVAAAVASTLRTSPDAIAGRGPARRLFVQLAYCVGAPPVSDVADRCGATVRTIQNLRRDPDPGPLAAARLCLADPRLRIHDASAAASCAFASVGPPQAR